MGPHAVLVETDASPASLAAAIRARFADGVVDVVPAARTVLVTVADERTLDDVRVALAGLAPDEHAQTGTSARTITIPVRYDGEDLAAVASACGTTVEDVIRRHTAREYRAAFCGFAPGFAYLSGLDARLHLPRRATPRARIAPGSVAIAAGWSAVYPAASPGGWHLLGHTDVAVWEPARPEPALLEPGTVVRFVDVGRVR
jgi:KipI family sensor histidine kinase inhibitor